MIPSKEVQCSGNKCCHYAETSYCHLDIPTPWDMTPAMHGGEAEGAFPVWTTHLDFWWTSQQLSCADAIALPPVSAGCCISRPEQSKWDL